MQELSQDGKLNQVSTLCHYFQSQECKSCQWIEHPYSQQLIHKENILRKALQISPNFQLEQSVSSPVLEFRNRAKMIVTGTTYHPIIGLTGEENLDEGREILQCPIHHPRLNEVIQALPEFIQTFNLTPYQIDSRKGELKGVILFYSPVTDQMYLRFILRSQECVFRIKKLLPSLQKKFPFITCVSANIQPIPHAFLDGPEEIFITEQNFIAYQLGKLVLNLAPQAFVQTNTEVAIQLYQTAANWIKAIHPNKMLDLFCGQGAFSFFAAWSSKYILGIEINEEAVNTANKTAARLGFYHVSFQCMDAKLAPSLGADLILVNPPRRGLTQTLKVIEQSLPEHLIYSSCSIDTLAKDMSVLTKNYTLEKIQIFDMFPHTEHFEILLLLKKSKVTS